MKNFFLVLLVLTLVVGGSIGLSYGFGWIGVHQTKTIYKAKENAKREVFEQSQSYVEAKRQSALKHYKEYKNASEDQKIGLRYIISQDFANFDEEKYLTGELKTFIYNCKYN